MNSWSRWWSLLWRVGQADPPRTVELLMLSLAIALLSMGSLGGDRPALPLLLLGLSYGMGAAASVLVRESLSPSPQRPVSQTAAIALIALGLYGIADVLHHL